MKKWRSKVSGHHLPLKCGSCGTLFHNGMVGFAGGSNVTFEDCDVECPNCGALCAMDSTIHKSGGGSFEVTGSSLATREALRSLAAIAKAARSKAKAKDSSLTVEEIINEVAGVSPELAKKLKERGLTVYLLILALFWIISQVSLEIKIDVNSLVDRAVEAVSGTPEAEEFPMPAEGYTGDHLKEKRPLSTGEMVRLQDRQARRFQRRELVQATMPRRAHDHTNGEA